MIVVPKLGELKEDDDFDNWLRSDPVSVSVLGGSEFVFILEDYVSDTEQEQFHQAIENFLSLGELALKKAESEIFQYYKDVNNESEPGDGWYVEIEKPQDVWNHIRFRGRVHVKRRNFRDKLIYIDIECDCDWEQEHGLQIVFKQGLFVNKVGAYDGHLTNSDSYAKDELENVIYQSF